MKLPFTKRLSKSERKLLKSFYDTNIPRSMWFVNLDNHEICLDYEIDDYLSGYTSQLLSFLSRGIKLTYGEKEIRIDEEILNIYKKQICNLNQVDRVQAQEYYDLMVNVIPILNKHIIS